MSDPDPGQASLQVEPPPAEPESGAPPVFQVIVRSLFAGLCTEVATLGLLLLLLRMADPTQSSGPLLFVGVYSGLVAGALFALAELRGIPGRFFGVGLALLLTPLVLVAVAFLVR